MGYKLSDPETNKKMITKVKIIIIIFSLFPLSVILYSLPNHPNSFGYWLGTGIGIFIVIYLPVLYFLYGRKYGIQQAKLYIEIKDDRLRGKNMLGQWEDIPFNLFIKKNMKVCILQNDYLFASFKDFLQNGLEILRKYAKESKYKIIVIEFRIYKGKRFRRLFNLDFSKSFLSSSQFENLLNEWREKYEAYLKRTGRLGKVEERAKTLK